MSLNIPSFSFWSFSVPRFLFLLFLLFIFLFSSILFSHFTYPPFFTLDLNHLSIHLFIVVWFMYVTLFFFHPLFFRFFLEFYSVLLFFPLLNTISKSFINPPLVSTRKLHFSLLFFIFILSCLRFCSLCLSSSFQHTI